MTRCDRGRKRRLARVVVPLVAGPLAFGLMLTAASATFLARPAQSQSGSDRGDIPRIDAEEATLRWLDKSTARVDQLSVPVGTTVALGGLDVTVHACRRTAPDQQPEHAAFLEIRDLNESDAGAGQATGTPLFQGWMFASSPSLSALEHPVYDVWVLECADAAEDMGDSEQTNAGAGADADAGPPLPPPLPPRRRN